MSKKLNCIFFGSFLYPQGYAATRRKQQFMDFILSQGDSVRVLLTLKRAKGAELNANQGAYNGIRYKVAGPFVKPNILLPFTFLIFLLRTFYLLAIYRKRDCKNLIVTFAVNYDSVIPLIFAKTIGYKIVFDVVEDHSTIIPKGKFTRRLRLTILNFLHGSLLKYLASGVSVITYYLLEKFQKQNLRALMTLVPVSADNILPYQDKTRRSDFTLLYSGTYGEKEGISSMLEACALFFEEVSSAKLILTGNCPDHIKQAISSNSILYRSVICTGRLDDELYFSTLREATVMLMTRTNSGFANAGFPYKLGEYLATGNPVICTDVSDVSIYLKHGISAFIVPPEDASALYQAIKYMYFNPLEATKIGFEGYRVCKNYFNPERNSKNFYQLLQIT
jgi:glycosyltransferase involved in cell wall biosynthesis